MGASDVKIYLGRNNLSHRMQRPAEGTGSAVHAAPSERRFQKRVQFGNGSTCPVAITEGSLRWDEGGRATSSQV